MRGDDHVWEGTEQHKVVVVQGVGTVIMVKIPVIIPNNVNCSARNLARSDGIAVPRYE